MNNRGFTLIELLIVIAIIGILTTIAVSGYIGVTLKAVRSEAYSNLENIRLLQERSFADTSGYIAAPNGPAIRAALPGFNPGGNPPGSGINYDYAITNADGVGLPSPVSLPYNAATAALPVANTPCFIATATGIAGTRAAGDIFAIDCNNVRNF